MEALKYLHVALKTNDFDRSMAFYTQCIGCTIRRVWGEGDGRAALIDFTQGCGGIEIFAGGKEGGIDTDCTGSLVHLAFDVEDVDYWYARALEYGAKPRSAPFDLFRDTPTGALDMRLAFVFGPDGEVLEFCHNK